MSSNNHINPMIPELFKITDFRHDTADTFTIECMPENKDLAFHFEPGQFNMVYIHGVGEIPISISGYPNVSEKIVHTTRAVGTVTKAMRKLEIGDYIGIRGPFGTAWPVDAAQGYDVVFIAGGIGLAPLRPALYQVLANRDLFGKVILLYGTRNPEDILYRDELERWRSRFDLEVYVTVDYADEDWRGSVGVVTTLIPRSPFDPHHTMAFLCGPEVMMRYSAIELMKRGVENTNIFVSLERNMKCAIGFCGHCQYGQHFICRDGPVFSHKDMAHLMNIWEL